MANTDLPLRSENAGSSDSATGQSKQQFDLWSHQEFQTNIRRSTFELHPGSKLRARLESREERHFRQISFSVSPRT
jgi:hypothetical protein